MTVINDFAALVESFKASAVNNFVAENSCEVDYTALETFLTPGATLIPICSFKRLAGSFDGAVVDYGVGVAARFVALVVFRGGDGPRVIFDSPCRSQNQAASEAENACREFAAESE